MQTVKSGLAGSPCIKLFACIEDHTQPGGERRIELGVLEPDNIRMLVQGAERIPTVFTDIASALMAFLNTSAPLDRTCSAEAGTTPNAESRNASPKSSLPNPDRVCGTNTDPIVTGFPKETLPYVKSGHNPSDSDSRPPQREYIPPLRPGRNSCEHWGRRFTMTAHPDGETKTTPHPCGTCDLCLKHRKTERTKQYAMSEPSTLSTVLACWFPTLSDADRYAKLPAHRKRVPGCRKHVGFQQPGEWVPDEPCLLRIIWDTEVPPKGLKTIHRHAEKAGAEIIDCDVRQVTPQQFEEWLPKTFSFMMPSGGRITTSRFSKGWAQKARRPNDWRNGMTRSAMAGKEDDRVSGVIQTDRARVIRASWMSPHKQSRDPELTPVQRAICEEEAVRALERARYVNLRDWLTCWQILEPEHIKTTKRFIDAYLRGKEPSARNWERKTQGPKPLAVEVARYLNGERDPEPAVMMAAEKLGFISLTAPAIDPDYLTELTNLLPPLSCENPVYDDDDEEMAY